MTKLLSILLVLIIVIVNNAIAENSYTMGFLSFSYDDTFLSIRKGDYREVDVNIYDKIYCLDYVNIYLLDGGNDFPTFDEYSEKMRSSDPNIIVAQKEWHGFDDVLMCEYIDGKFIESQFHIPIYDESHNIFNSLIIKMTIGKTDNDNKLRIREEAINHIIDSLEFTFNNKVVRSLSDTSNENEVSSLLGRALTDVVTEYNLTETEFSDDEIPQYEGEGLWIRSNGKEVDCVAIIGSTAYRIYDVSYNMKINSALETLSEYGFEFMYDVPEDGDYYFHNESKEISVHLKKDFDGNVVRIDLY